MGNGEFHFSPRYLSAVLGRFSSDFQLKGPRNRARSITRARSCRRHDRNGGAAARLPARPIARRPPPPASRPGPMSRPASAGRRPAGRRRRRRRCAPLQSLIPCPFEPPAPRARLQCIGFVDFSARLCLTDRRVTPGSGSMGSVDPANLPEVGLRPRSPPALPPGRFWRAPRLGSGRGRHSPPARRRARRGGRGVSGRCMAAMLRQQHAAVGSPAGAGG